MCKKFVEVSNEMTSRNYGFHPAYDFNFNNDPKNTDYDATPCECTAKQIAFHDKTPWRGQEIIISHRV